MWQATRTSIMSFLPYTEYSVKYIFNLCKNSLHIYNKGRRESRGVKGEGWDGRGGHKEGDERVGMNKMHDTAYGNAVINPTIFHTN